MKKFLLHINSEIYFRVEEICRREHRSQWAELEISLASICFQMHFCQGAMNAGREREHVHLTNYREGRWRLLERTGGQQRVVFCVSLSKAAQILVCEWRLCSWLATFLTLKKRHAVWIQHAGLVVAKQLVLQARKLCSPPDPEWSSGEWRPERK